MWTELLALCALAGAPEGIPAKRVLVYTKSAGFEHDVVKHGPQGELSLVETTWVELARASPHYEVEIVRDAAELEPNRLRHYDAVFFYTTGELPLSPTARVALIDFVKSGGAFVGAHSATDTFYTVPDYGEMIGAYFDGHPWHQSVRVRVEDPRHPATRHLGQSFEIVDEIYQFRAPYDRTKLHVLLSLDVSGLDLTNDKNVHRTDGDFALAWCKDWSNGRVFYTALGHRAEVWKDERFLRHLECGLLWALRVESAAVELPPAEREYQDFARDHAGDPMQGFKLFRDEGRLMCGRCHAVHGQGGSIGPDLSAIAKQRTRQELIVSVLAPSFEIAQDWKALSVELDDGRLVFGRVARESDSELWLWDTNGQSVPLEKARIAQRLPSSTSLMPDGLARLVSREEFADLVAYLSTLKTPPAPK